MANNTSVRQRWQRHISILILSLLASLALVTCTKKPHDDILNGLSPELARHLTSSDDSTLACFVRDIGYEDLLRTQYILLGQEEDLWIASRESDALVARGFAKRIASIFAAERNESYHLRNIEFREQLPSDQLDKLHRTRHDLSFINKDQPESAVDRLDAFNRLMATFESLADTAAIAMCKWHISFAQEDLGNYEANMATLQAAYKDFDRIGNRKMTCEALGILGGNYERAGHIDSMIVCYEEAMRIANRSRMGSGAARVLTFYAGYYQRQGRLDLARLLLLRAADVARAYNSGYREIRFLYEAMRFHADLGCWDVVEELLTQAQGVKRRARGKELKIFEIFFLRTDVIEARLKMTQGDVAGAEAILDGVLHRMQEIFLPRAYRAMDDLICFYRAEGFLENGRAKDALAATREALSRPPDESVPFWSARLALLMAQAALEMDEVDIAETALDEFDRFSKGEENSLRHELTKRDALCGRIALSRGDTPKALAALGAGLSRLERTAATIDASVGSYIWLAGCEDLRRFMHDLTRNDPLAGYGAELYWRELFAQLGAKHRGMRAPSQESASVAVVDSVTRDIAFDFNKLMPDIRAHGKNALARAAALDAIHCVYLVRDGEIWRWTASRIGIRREVLPTETSVVRGLVTRAVKMMSAHPRERDTAPSGELCETLRKLAHALLPLEILEVDDAGPESAPVFFVTTDGFLGQIPFETLCVGDGDAYEPLLADRDVAYLRSTTAPPPRSATGPGLILVNTEAARRRDRYVNQPTLRHVELEGEAVYRENPTAVYLSGNAATKRRLTSSWKNAPCIYMATHTICDPEVPYLVMIPLSVPADEHAPDAGYLDITDIRDADLGACEIVVLSSCSSGVPYVESETLGPSLGDTFLDAGAGAVVHTFWNVKDEDASRIGIAFVRSWKKAGTPAVRALSDVRRDEMRGPNGIRHPSCWASYAIKLSRF